jgi:hypothetical protein
MKSPTNLIFESTDTLLIRHPANPILTSKDWPYPSVFNAGATLLADAGWRIAAVSRISAPRVH